MLTLVIEGGVFATTTALLATAVPGSSPSKGVAVQTSESPASKEAPSMVSVVTEGLLFTVHSQV